MNIAYVTSLSGYRISGFEYPSYDDRPPWPHTPEGHQRCSQLFFDPVIQKRAESFQSVSTRYRTLFRSFEQDDDGVTVTIEDRDGAGALAVGRAGVGVGRADAAVVAGSRHGHRISVAADHEHFAEVVVVGDGALQKLLRRGQLEAG